MNTISDTYRQKLARKRRVLRLNRMMRRRKLERSREFAYLGLTALVLAVLFWITPWIIGWSTTVYSKTKLNTETSSGEMQFLSSKTIALQKGRLYTFTLKPDADIKGYKDESIENGIYVELLNKEGQRIYSFKNFYDRSYLYSQEDAEYEMPMTLHINETGDYKMRVLASNKAFDKIDLTVEQKLTGSLYYGYYKWIFLGGAILLLVSNANIGSPREWLSAIQKKRAKIKNWQSLVALLAIILYIGTVVINVTHYGYAGYGGYNHAPTSWFNDQYVYYLGP